MFDGEKKIWINVQADIEVRIMLDALVAEAPYETDRSKIIRQLIKQEFARQHPEVVKIEELPRPEDSGHVIPVITQKIKVEN